MRFADVAFDWPHLVAAARDLLAESPARPAKEPEEARILAVRRLLRTVQRQFQELQRENERRVLLGVGHDLRETVHHGFAILNRLSGFSEEERGTQRQAVYQILFPGERADGIVERAQADFCAGRRKKAKERFAEARAMDPLDPDVLTSEANCYLNAGDPDSAEPLFSEALALAQHQIPLNRRVLDWGELEVRPYGRAAHGIALVLEKRGEYREALRIWLDLAALCPDDGLGVRYCLGATYHRLGDLDTAIDWYERHLQFPEQKYNLATARHSKGDVPGALASLLDAFMDNPYIPPLLLGEVTREADIWHDSNAQGLEWAQDYVARHRGLWTAPALDFLSCVYRNLEVSEAFHEIRALRRTLKNAEVGSEKRTRAVDALYARKQFLPPNAVKRVLQAIERTIQSDGEARDGSV